MQNYVADDYLLCFGSIPTCRKVPAKLSGHNKTYDGNGSGKRFCIAMIDIRGMLQGLVRAIRHKFALAEAASATKLHQRQALTLNYQDITALRL